MMRPRYEEVSSEAEALLKKAQYLAKRVDAIEKASMADKDKYCMKRFGKKYSDCSSKQKAQCDKAHGKVEKASMADKDKYCMKNFGKKYSDCSAKQKAQCDKAHGKVKKAVQPNYESQASFKPAGFHFVTETGGQTKSAGYYTNQQTLEVDDVANKGAISSSFNVEELAKRMNAHQNGIQDRDVSTDNKQPDRD